MKILVTGGAGFVGSHLCERLAKNKTNKVYSLDNYFTGSINNHVENVTYIKGSTVNIDKLVKFKPNIVYHLGEYSRVEQSFDDIRKVWEFNKDGTFEVLEFVRKTGCKIIYAGSSTKYGDAISPYSWTKATNTELVINYGQWFNIPYAITYFYNVYGPREIKTGKYATLIALFKEKMKNHQILTVRKPGTQKRNFTHIEDTIDGLVLAGEKGFGDEFGIGSPESYTIIEIAQMFGGKIKMIPGKKGNRKIAKLVTKKTRALGWKPKRNIKEYIHNLRKNNWQ
jgi:UDP-glucose 4-epimerase